MLNLKFPYWIYTLIHFLTILPLKPIYQQKFKKANLPFMTLQAERFI